MPRNFKTATLFVLSLVVGIASADIIVDGQTIPSVDIQSITIDPDTGNITVVTESPGYTVSKNSGDGVQIASFTANPTVVEEGSTTTLSWSTVNAVSCTAVDGTGGWAGSTISLPDGNTEITIATAGQYTFKLTCNGATQGDQVTRTVNVTATIADAVAITSFTASPNPIDEGGSTTVSWTTVNAVSCTASGGTGGWAGSSISLPSGSFQTTIEGAGNYPFTLTCDGATQGDQDVAQVTVTVNGGGIGCSTPTLSGQITDWATVWGVDFPGPVYSNKNRTVPEKGYLAIEFNSGTFVDSGFLASVANTATSGVRLGTISQCDGEFVDVAPECTHIWGIGGGIGWTTEGVAGLCQLDPNTTYYFNVTFTDGVDPDSTTCSSTPCVVTLQHSNF